MTHIPFTIDLVNAGFFHLHTETEDSLRVLIDVANLPRNLVSLMSKCHYCQKNVLCNPNIGFCINCIRYLIIFYQSFMPKAYLAFLHNTVLNSSSFYHYGRGLFCVNAIPDLLSSMFHLFYNIAVRLTFFLAFNKFRVLWRFSTPDIHHCDRVIEATLYRDTTPHFWEVYKHWQFAFPGRHATSAATGMASWHSTLVLLLYFSLLYKCSMLYLLK